MVVTVVAFAAAAPPATSATVATTVANVRFGFFVMDPLSLTPARESALSELALYFGCFATTALPDIVRWIL
ncbi:hypothetical protein [Agromyces archimandritae]|uniref:Secreted peptide n=1 Tax=Agromyces archimandritae TaxID=2781962 RepID=A0A975IN77_9MICO|nr:hypothetical protein [Agromyces archimandritae]QTX03964.1 hypothetical protein G127AT_11700 [Agromyces archimandritae]